VHPDTFLDASFQMTQTRKVEQEQGTVWTDIVSLRNESRDVNVRFKVLKKGVTRRVTSRSSGRQYEIVDCFVADTTARISLTLWNEDIQLVDQDGWYCILHGTVNVFDECMTLSRGRTGEFRTITRIIDPIRDDIDMSRPFMGKTKQRERRPKTGRTLNGTTCREVERYASRKSF
jgi:hypothetical protein